MCTEYKRFSQKKFCYQNNQSIGLLELEFELQGLTNSLKKTPFWKLSWY